MDGRISCALLLFVAHLFLGTSAFAIVDMRNANYADSFTDWNGQGTGYDLRVYRTYNSRTLHNGLFGFGWCSDFETKLSVTPANTIIITECGAGARLEYLPSSNSASSQNELIKEILEKAKAKNPRLTPDQLAEIKSRVSIDPVLLEEFAKQLKIEGKVASGVRYQAPGRSNEYITVKSNGDKKIYIRTLVDGSYQEFSENGLIDRMFDKNGNYLKLQYGKEDRLVGLVDNDGRKLTFEYHPSMPKIALIKGPKNVTMTYKYTGEDLVAVKDGWGDQYGYEYDDLHNLIKISFPDKTFKAISYNKDRDWVTGFTDRKNCTESYNYEENKKDPFNHYWSTLTKTCDKKVVHKSRYEFFHKQLADGSRYLHRTTQDENGSKVDITFHPKHGKPMQIIRGDVQIQYSYNDNGSLKQKVEPTSTTSFEYASPCNKVAMIKADYFQLQRELASSANKAKMQKGASKKLVKQVTTQFLYDEKKCQLKAAKNSDGVQVSISYDPKGRVEEIKDQAKKVVKIKYETRFGKPSFVSRPGLGSITVNYKDDGSIKEVKSKEGPVVAVQVANIFNNLLELIAPANGEASI
jgi:YD repeat-containing protein